MGYRKKHSRSLFYWLMLLLFCFQALQAQPTCWANFDPWDTCHRDFRGKEFIFLGRVDSVLSRTREDSYSNPVKVVVEVESPLKGDLPRRFELLLDQRCFGTVSKNQRYIFTANRIDNEEYSGIFSTRWSQPLSDEKFSKEDVNEIVSEVRSIINGTKQPRLSGNVIEQLNKSRGRYGIASNGVKKLFAFDYLRPLADVTVTAKLKDTGKEYKTATDADGAFVFNDLPRGIFEIFTNLPTEYDVRTNGTSVFGENGKTFLKIDDSICGSRVIFNAQLQGGVKIRFDNASSLWSHIIVHLWSVFETKDGERKLGEFSFDAAKDKFPVTRNSGDIGYNYHFKNVPAGKYLLMLSVTTDPAKATERIYYPGTFDEKNATIINIEAGKTSNLEFSIPDLPER